MKKPFENERKNFMKKIISSLIAVTIALSMAIPVNAYDTKQTSTESSISETELSMENNYEVTYQEYISKNVGDIVVLDNSDPYVIVSREICQFEDSNNTYYVSTQYKPLISLYTDSITGWYAASNSFTYNTGTTITATLKVRFEYDGTNAPTVYDFKYIFSDTENFQFDSVNTSSNIFTKSTTVKLKYKYLTGLGYEDSSVSVKCLKDGTQG